jgi:tyrosine-protein kinase Etk/Wzc
MQQANDSTTAEIDPVAAIRKYPILVAAFAVAFGFVGAVYASEQTPTFVASAGLVVEDTGSSIVEARSGDAERYVADQVAILQSRAVAERASALADTLEPGGSVSVDELLATVSITSDADSDFIAISFEAGDPLTAQIGANAMGAAYREIVSAANAEAADTAVRQLDEAIDGTVAEIEALQADIEAERSNSDERAALDQQIDDIVSNLAELRRRESQASSAGDPVANLEEIEAFSARANQLVAELQARLLVSEVEARVPATALLLQQQQDATGLLSELTLRRSQIQVDTQLAGSGVAFFDPAGLGRRRGIARSSGIIVGTVLGGLLGAGLAFWLSQRRERIEHRLVPRDILGVPLLAEVTYLEQTRRRRTFLRRRRKHADEDEKSLHGDLLGPEDATSPSTAAFRVLAAAIQRRASDLREATGETRRAMVVAMVGSVIDEGTSVVATKTAIAAARSGLRVVLVDCDLGAQDAFQMISRLPNRVVTTGLGDVVRYGTRLDDAVLPVEVGDGMTLSLLGRGSTPLSTPDFFSSPAVSRVIEELDHRFDLVVLDLPPLLQVGYSNAAMQQADRAVLVVRHGGRLANLHEARHRLGLIGVPLLGYVYYDAPARKGIAPANPRSDNVAAREARP